MTYNQITIYMPAVTEVGTKYVQGINRETYIENPANNYWYLLEKLLASGESRECRIREIEYDCTVPCGFASPTGKKLPPQARSPLSRNIIEYRDFQEFFNENEAKRCLSPIMHAPSYLTIKGASSHSLFYAWKTPSGQYKRFSPIKSHVSRLNPSDNIDYPAIVPVIVLPNGKIIEDNLNSREGLSIRFQQTSSIYDADILLWNLNLAKNALLSNFPDDAILLYGHIAAFSIQLFGKLIPELFQAVFDVIAENPTDYFQSHNVDIGKDVIDERIHDMRKLHIKCGGWWRIHPRAEVSSVEGSGEPGGNTETSSNNRLIPSFILCNAYENR